MSESGAPNAPAAGAKIKATANVTREYLSRLLGKQFPNRPAMVLTPDFEAPINFSELSGKKLLLFFMPGPSDPDAPITGSQLAEWKTIDEACGCTSKCKDLASAVQQLPDEVQAVVVSTASAEALRRVNEKLGPNSLWFASEPQASIVNSFPLSRPRFQFEGTSHFGRFTLLLEEAEINESMSPGVITAAWPSTTAVDQVLSDVVKLTEQS